MKVSKALGCQIGDHYCMKAGGTLLQCDECSSWACLSCSVPDRTRGGRWVCHVCARLAGGAVGAAVEHHVAVLAGARDALARGHTLFGSKAAERDRPIRRDAWTGGTKPLTAQERYQMMLDRASPSVTLREERRAPARPLRYPKARMEKLGYAGKR